MRLAVDFENTDGVGTLLESLSLEICLFLMHYRCMLCGKRVILG